MDEITLTGIKEIDEQVLAGKTCGYFGFYEGSKMGGKFWINNKNEVDYKHTTYFDVYDPADWTQAMWDKLLNKGDQNNG